MLHLGLQGHKTIMLDNVWLNLMQITALFWLVCFKGTSLYMCAYYLTSFYNVNNFISVQTDIYSKIKHFDRYTEILLKHWDTRAYRPLDSSCHFYHLIDKIINSTLGTHDCFSLDFRTFKIFISIASVSGTDKVYNAGFLNFCHWLLSFTIFVLVCIPGRCLKFKKSCCPDYPGN